MEFVSFFGFSPNTGAAVQGIEEELDVDYFYLNRANDGFVFYDDGCYTCGPVNSKKGHFFLSNLMIGNSRILISSRTDQDMSLVETTASYRKRKHGISEDKIPLLRLEPNHLS